jgi:molecular chaperone GrpE
MKSPDEDNQGPVIRDRRRIDPVTGQVRDTGQGGSVKPGPGQARPGRHSVSRPGGIPGAAAPGAPGGGAGSARPGTAPGPESGYRAAGAPGGAGPAADSSANGPGGDGPGANGLGADGPGGGRAGTEAGGPGAAGDAAARLAERTADLQRLQAEYANYRKRVERDRMAVRELALSSVLSGLLPVLDDIGRAREHEELTGGFKSVADSLEAAAAKLGLTTYGEAGDPFDPNLHEALMHSYSGEVYEPTCVRILQPGYKVGDRILRAARVAVAEPGDGTGETATSDSGQPADSQGDAPPAPDREADKPGDHAPAGAD